MARKTSRHVAASKPKKSPARKGRKSPATKRANSAKARSASASLRKAVSAENFVRSIRTLHNLGLIDAFMQSAETEKLTLTMDSAAFERVKKSVNKLRRPAPVLAELPSPASAGLAKREVKPPPDFGSNAAPGGWGGVKPLPGDDPWDF
ncbi:hypothetical protein ACE103_07435 [Bradyrhizobium sp. ma5]|uniref:hypothetical protein n=1 Tax=unclassified Bradyrhizobium TaxID=2631580 RepID=UPI0035D5590A